MRSGGLALLLESPFSVSRSLSCLLARRDLLTQNMWTVYGGTCRRSIALKCSPVLQLTAALQTPQHWSPVDSVAWHKKTMPMKNNKLKLQLFIHNVDFWVLKDTILMRAQVIYLFLQLLSLWMQDTMITLEFRDHQGNLACYICVFMFLLLHF